ncbi:MAG: glycosyltransferase family 39 protein [Prolixibacteraceae bacterium]|jgi:4-amino-4-deoxy-L-arabinose transferase|nr:glycosyltransferase family 39 protein [Prolixibacteraceae bacterium]
MKNKIYYLLFLGIICFCSFIHLGQWGVLESSEARYAEISREMLTSGDFLQPQLQGIYHFDKPPVTYWITSLGQKLFGTTPFGSRFFLSIAYLLQLILVFSITFKWFNQQRLSEIITIIYASLPVVIMSVRNLTTDAYLNTFSLLSIFLFTLHRKGKHPNIYLLLWGITLSILFMIKGPVAWLLPILFIYPIIKICPQQNKVHRWIPWFTGIMVLILGGLWYAILIKNNTGLWDFFTKEQLVDRFANAQIHKRSEPFYYYLYTYIPALLPWCFIPFTKIDKYTNSVKTIILFTVVIPMIFFSIASSKLILYPLPTAFSLAVWFGYVFNRMISTKAIKRHQLIEIFFLLLPLGLGAYAFILLEGVSHWWYILLVIATFFLYVVTFIRKEAKDQILIASLAIPMILVPFSGYILNKMIIDVNGTTPVTNFIQDRGLQHLPIVVYNQRVASFDFQLQNKTYAIEDGSYLLKRNTSFQRDNQWSKYLLSFKTQKEQIIQLLSKPSILIFKRHIPKQAEILTRYYDKQKQIGKWIIFYNLYDIESSKHRFE